MPLRPDRVHRGARRVLTSAASRHRGQWGPLPVLMGRSQVAWMLVDGTGHRKTRRRCRLNVELRGAQSASCGAGPQRFSTACRPASVIDGLQSAPACSVARVWRNTGNPGGLPVRSLDPARTGTHSQTCTRSRMEFTIRSALSPAVNSYTQILASATTLALTPRAC